MVPTFAGLTPSIPWNGAWKHCDRPTSISSTGASMRRSTCSATIRLPFARSIGAALRACARQSPIRAHRLLRTARITHISLSSACCWKMPPRAKATKKYRSRSFTIVTGGPRLTFSGSGKFLCNICDNECDRPPEGITREGMSCPVCHSSARVRAAIALLSEELLGVAMSLADFPVMKGIRAIGMSDSAELAERLAQKLDYTNTFYHQAPQLDATNPDPRDFGRYDFILTSEV